MRSPAERPSARSTVASVCRRYVAVLVFFFLGWLLQMTAGATLIGYWGFDNSGNVGQDTSGGGNNLTSANAAAYSATGHTGGGLALNGTNQYLYPAGGTVAGLPIGNSNYTVSVWFKPSALGDRGFVGWGLFGTSRRVNALRLLNTNGGNAFRHYWWGADLDATTATNLLNGSWQHVAAVFNGTTRTIYLNGTQIAQDSPGVNNSTNNNFRIGSTNGGEYFSGTLDDVAIWDNALSQSQIQNLAAGGSPLALGPQITSFTATPASAYEGQNVQLAWTVNTGGVAGTYSYTIARGATQIASGTAASGTVNTAIPDLAGAAQVVTYTFSAIETGGNNVTNTATATVTADPGIPSATPQSGLTVQQPNALNITLGGIDPNGGTLTFAVVAQPLKGSVGIAGNIATFSPNLGASGVDAFTFKVNDGKYDSAPAKVSVTLNPVAAPPTGITLDASVVPDTAVGGTLVANIGSTDVNFNDAHTFTLVAGSGATDNARFSVSGHQLRAAQSFEGLAGQSFSIRLRATDSTGGMAEQVFALGCATITRGIVVNEVLYNGVDNTVRDEFIELYNAGTTTVNLTGWRLSSAVDFNFPANTTIAPGGYLLIAEDPATITAKFGKTALGPWTGNLSSKGEIIRLRNATDVIVSEVDYKAGFPWPTSSDGDGASMELINPKFDESLGGNWRAATIPSLTATTDTATPGAQNLQFAANAAPAVRQVNHTPAQATTGDPIVVTAKVTDPDGVASVQLLYQIVAPGNFIPSTLPRAISGGQFTSTTLPLPANPAFENAANWATAAMNDDGLGADVQGGDGIYTATIPFQPNRTLVRYRIVAVDNPGASIRVPYSDDPSLNFACFVYDGVPAYQGTPAATLTSLPTYQFLTRGADYDQCVAYNAANQLTTNTPSWTFENWEAAFISDGVVRDHIVYRLHGANGRYSASGVAGAAATSKRAFKFIFNKGAYFQGRDNSGQSYPVEWKTMVTENCWENRATYTFSLNEAVNFYVWNQLGVPAPFANFAHFRTIKQTAEQPDPWHGDFWGLMFVHEDYDGQFLDGHNLPKGNVYKLTKDGVSGLSQQRYQAALAVKDGSDHDDLQNNLRGTSTPAYITGRVNLDLWARYHAYAEAIRHYDYWPSGDNNAGYYFYPDYNAANANKGVLWYLPSDVDATWGPTWNNGRDLVHNSLFNDTGDAGGDASTNPTLWPRYYNQVREIRDLLWQTDQINPLIDQFAAIIQPFVNADFARWYGAPSDAGNFNGLAGFGMSSSVGQTSLAAYVAGMKDFAFDADNNGSTWPGANVGVGGRAAFLDTKQAENGESALFPYTPLITFTGPGTHPVNALNFTTSAFSDPQPGTFAAVQWRMAEVNTSATYTPGVPRLLEIAPSYDSGEITTFASAYRFPAVACRAGQTYRARVRHKDTSGRWSHWSAPVEFTASAADVSAYTSSLVISEFMYHPLSATAGEVAQGWTADDFEYIELRNVSATSLDLSDVRFTKGVNFDFAPGTTLAAGANILVVRNVAAFTSRYGAGKPIAGTWLTGDFLANSGEQLKLSYGSGQAIIDFTYSDIAPWPTQADGLGYTLVLISPETRPNPALAQSWRVSRAIGGSPGGDDRPTFATWAATRGVSDPNADDDADGIWNRMEYALGGDPRRSDGAMLTTTAIAPVTVSSVTSNYLTLTFRRQVGAEDIGYHVDFTSDFSGWNETALLASSAFNGDGTVTETWRTPQPAASGQTMFLRLRVTPQ